jgi:hypothetical protein
MVRAIRGPIVLSGIGFDRKQSGPRQYGKSGEIPAGWMGSNRRESPSIRRRDFVMARRAKRCRMDPTKLMDNRVIVIEAFLTWLARVPGAVPGTGPGRESWRIQSFSVRDLALSKTCPT